MWSKYKVRLCLDVSLDKPINLHKDQLSVRLQLLAVLKGLIGDQRSRGCLLQLRF